MDSQTAKVRTIAAIFTHMHNVRSKWVRLTAPHLKVLQQLKMDEGIEWRQAEDFIYADRNPYVGPQAVLDGVLMRFGAEWDAFTVTPEEWLDAGNHVVVLGTYTGPHKASGKTVRAQFAHVWAVKGSRVLRFQQYTDTKQFAEVAA